MREKIEAFELELLARDRDRVKAWVDLASYGLKQP